MDLESGPLLTKGDDLLVLELFWRHEDISGKLKEGSLASCRQSREENYKKKNGGCAFQHLGFPEIFISHQDVVKSCCLAMLE